jgi:hypothetical protein
MTVERRGLIARITRSGNYILEKTTKTMPCFLWISLRALKLIWKEL